MMHWLLIETGSSAAADSREGLLAMMDLQRGFYSTNPSGIDGTERVRSLGLAEPKCYGGGDRGGRRTQLRRREANLSATSIPGLSRDIERNMIIIIQIISGHRVSFRISFRI